MKEKHYLLNTLLAAVLGLALAVCVLLRTFMPTVILPKLDIPAMVLVSLAALVLNHYMAPNTGRRLICSAVLAAVTFGLLPWCAGFVTGAEALKLGLFGGIVFAVIAALFGSIQDRLSTGPAAKLAPVLSALGLYLAAQCFAGIGL